MQTVQSAHILAVRACFAAETLGVGTILDGEFLFVHDNIAIDVRYGNFGGGNQIQVVQIAVVHLSFLVGQLACAVSAVGVNDCGRHNLFIASLACLVQEEVDERSLQLCALAAVNGEAGSADLHAQVKVNQVIFLSQFPVGELVFRFLGNNGPVAHRVSFLALAKVALYNQILFRAFSFGNKVVGYVGNGTQQAHHFFFCLGLLVFQLLVGLFQGCHLGLDLLGLFLQSLLHQRANLGGHLLGFGQVLVQFCLCLSALLVGLNHFLNGIGGIGEILFFQSFYYAFFFFRNDF